VTEQAGRLPAAAPQQAELDPEDVKILTLARSSRARRRTPSGAAVRDVDGRTYAASDVDLPSLRLSALEVAVAMAVSSGAAGLEAAAVVTALAPSDVDPRAVGDLGGPGVPVHVAGPDGVLVATLRT
jgi:hypothetical protein